MTQTIIGRRPRRASREPAARVAAPGQGPLGQQRRHVEDATTWPSARARPERGTRAMIGQEMGRVGDPDADRHDRLTERYYDDQAVPLGEVRRPSAGASRRRRGAPVPGGRRPARPPRARSGGPVGRAATRNSDGAAEHRGGDAELAAQPGVVGGADQNNPRCSIRYDEVAGRDTTGPGQPAGQVVEGLGDGRRGDEHGRHRGEQARRTLPRRHGRCCPASVAAPAPPGGDDEHPRTSRGGGGHRHERGRPG